ncbi:MAG: thiolase family protein [Sulfolobales archaeon]
MSMACRKVYIASASMIRVSRYFTKSYKELAFDVVDEISRNLSNDGLNNIDYVIVSNVFSDSMLDQLDISTILTQELGLTPKPALRIETGESSGLAAIAHAYALIKSGLASSVLVIGVEKSSEYPTTAINKHLTKLLDYEVESIYDFALVNEAAFLMKEYMERYRYSREDLSSWSVKMHSNAVRNPYAQLKFTVTKEQVVNSQVLSDPLRLLDSFPIGDGAAAILLTSNDGLISNSDYVEIEAVFQATALPLNLRDNILELPATKLLFSRLVKECKVDINDAVLEIHDSYSILGYLIIEELGLVRRGKAPEVINDLNNVNLSGGLKARGHPIGATGVYQVAEIFKILTEGLGDVRRNVTWGLAHSMSALDLNSAVVVVRRCR